ncbi:MULTISPECIES: NYN domain-containing protein [Delftia]|jgi:uncharacterized LabA/DUF88 family protein|uniref:NYN domain-containing protein n=2 Tax=Delftia TaxID=80865 RepID=A0A1H3TU00_9BURK|nr:MULTISPECIES: NYN domain-containing protein [Delftia]EPD36125.1 hypothetical protein HMPREF9701_04944 [Delftia acidovorans CCUG 274B]MPT54999.1 NYN domain-containing protein [Delftia sp.]SDZ53632.1 NYN domain-containing protein [Delftia lacustris]
MTYRTSVYVDGFNLYFGALKGTPYKWLNIRAMCEHLLDPHNQIDTIKYFTAFVSGTPADPDKPHHQQAYLRALRHVCPETQVIKGLFRTYEVTKRLVTPINGAKHARVLETTEKGSDVNLAVHLLNDAWLDKFDCAIVISGDSDLAESIRLVRNHHPKKVVGVIAPGKRSMSKELIKASNFIRAVSTSALSSSQFPDTIPGTSIHKPSDW